MKKYVLNLATVKPKEKPEYLSKETWEYVQAVEVFNNFTMTLVHLRLYVNQCTITMIEPLYKCFEYVQEESYFMNCSIRYQKQWQQADNMERRLDLTDLGIPLCHIKDADLEMLTKYIQRRYNAKWFIFNRRMANRWQDCTVRDLLEAMKSGKLNEMLDVWRYSDRLRYV